MIQIEGRTFIAGTPTLMQVTASIADGIGSISYKLFDDNHIIVTWGNLPVDEEFALAYDGSEIMAGNYIANYLGVTII